jgi:hypothetical protein
MSKRGSFRLYNPFRAYRRTRRGKPSKLWTMSETAPFQVPFCAYFFITGLSNLLTGVLTPESVDHTYPVWLVIAWSACVTTGSGLSLAGRWFEAFRMESSGLAFVLASCGIYIGAVIYFAGLKGSFSALPYIAIATGCIIRMLVIRKHHKAQRYAGQLIANGDVPQ